MSEDTSHLAEGSVYFGEPPENLHLMRGDRDYEGRHSRIHERSTSCFISPACRDLGRGWIAYNGGSTCFPKCTPVTVILRDGTLSREGIYKAADCPRILAGESGDVIYYRLSKIKEKKRGRGARKFDGKYHIDSVKLFMASILECDMSWGIFVRVCQLVLHTDSLYSIIKRIRERPVDSKWLDENGYVFAWEQTKVEKVEKVGGTYCDQKEGDTYLLCASGPNTAVLVNKKTGAYVMPSAPVVDIYAITQAEWDSVRGPFDLKLCGEK